MAGGIWGSTDSDHIYKHIRSEIQHEQSLMNVRVNWLIASQAFLFVPLAIGIDPRQSLAPSPTACSSRSFRT